MPSRRKKIPKNPPPENNGGRLKQLLKLSVGALSSTEEGLRRALHEMKIPRDATSFVTDQLSKRKTEIMSLLRDEIHKAIHKIDLMQFVRNIVKEYDLEVNATIRFLPKKR